MVLMKTKGLSKYDEGGMVMEQMQPRAMKQLLDNATELNNCSTAPLIGTKGGSEYDEDGMMTHWNYKFVITGCMRLGQLKVGSSVIYVWSQKEMKC